MTSELLLELLSEEIPARMQSGASETLKNIFIAKMAVRGLSALEIQTYVTPRRLVLRATGLPVHQQDQREERRGPRVDAPVTALEGFQTAIGQPLETCEQRRTPKGTFYFAWLETKGQAVATLLPEIVQEIIQEFSWPKSMRWGHGQQTWIRPLKGGFCLFQGQAVPFTVDLKSSDGSQVSFGNTSYGHPFLSPDAFVVTNFSQYQEELKHRFVLLDGTDRKQRILEDGACWAATVNCRVRPDPSLLEEVAGLVEWPVVYLGQIEPSFMTLPPEVLVIAMRVHQRYFVLENPDGSLAPYFLIVANTVTRDQGETVIRGNERVLKARLADAHFFYTQDQKPTLAQHSQKLAQVVFQEKLGTMADKGERLQQAAMALAPLFGLDPQQASLGASLLKADLVTEMVGEFPELQGIIGSYYAQAEGINTQICAAIKTHYLPRGPQDALPSTPLGLFLALLDRWDTLVGFFSVGLRATGSKDPYALRRTALGILRLLESVNIDINFDIFLDHFASAFPAFDARAELLTFLEDRLKVYWRDQGISYDVINAVLSQSSSQALSLLKQRCQILDVFLKQSSNNDGQSLVAAYRRVVNILTQAEQNEGRLFATTIQENLLEDAAEQDLYAALQTATLRTKQLMKQQDFKTALVELAQLKPFLDVYFETVMVNSPREELRNNRFNTLSAFRHLLNRLADFSKIEEGAPL